MPNADTEARIANLCNSDDRRVRALALSLDDIACALDNVDAASVVVERFTKRASEAIDILREAKRMYEDAAAIVVAEALEAAEAPDAQERYFARAEVA